MNADTLTVTYVDADDGQGNFDVPVSDTAVTDCVAPVISNVLASGVTGNSAVIQWLTDDPATSVVHYGPAIPPGLTTSAGALVSGHAVALTGLAACSNYYYSVESVDAHGNVTVDTNGGNYYLFTTLQNTNAAYTSTDTPLAIPDNNATGATSTINVADLDKIVDLNVVVNITHTYDGDISLSLIAPDGTTIALSNRRGSSGDNYTGTVFDDAAATAIASGTAPFTGSYRPENPLSAVIGKVASGAWKLKVVDSASSDSGTIVSWSLQFTYEPRVCGPSAVYQSFSVAADSCAAGGPGNGNGIVDRGDDVTLPVVIRNNGAIDLTGVSATLTTTTPDVYVTRAVAVYPNLAVNATAASVVPHFGFIAGLGVPCGSDIAFVLTVRTNQGTFSSPFTVKVGALAYATTTYPSIDVPKPIPDNSTTGASSTIAVTDTNPVQKVKVKVNITHTFDGDLTLYADRAQRRPGRALEPPRLVRRQLRRDGLRRRGHDADRQRGRPLHRVFHPGGATERAERDRGQRDLDVEGRRLRGQRHRDDHGLVARTDDRFRLRLQRLPVGPADGRAGPAGLDREDRPAVGADRRRDLVPALPRRRGRPAGAGHRGGRLLPAADDDRSLHRTGAARGAAGGRAVLVPGARGERRRRGSGRQRDGRAAEPEQLGRLPVR